MAVSQIIGASIADGAIAAIDITDGTITTAKLAATTGSGNVVLSAAPTLTGNTSLVNLTVSGTQTNSTLTSGRVHYSTTGGLLTDSSNLQFDGTNLGIGVTPASWLSTWKALQVSNRTSLAEIAGITFLGNNFYQNTSSQNIYLQTGYATLYSQNSGQHNWQIAPSGTAGDIATLTQAMTLDASGYLGIGTTAPSSYGGLAVRKAVTVSSVPVSASFSDSSNSTFDIRHSANIVNLSAQGSGITIDTGNSTRMTITSTGLVGIGGGAGSPSAALGILATGMNNQIALGVNTSNANYGSISLNGNSADSGRIGFTGGGSGDNSLYIDVPTAGAYAFRQGANTVLQILSSGNVGINNVSPATKLDVDGTGYFRGLLYISGSHGISSDSGSPILFKINGTEKMQLDASGNLALGISSGYRTAAGYVALAINATSGSLIDLYASGTRHGGVAATGGGMYVSSVTATPLIFSTTDVERMRILSTGQVGIGTSSPNTLFSVSHVASAETSIGIQHSSNNAQLLRIGWNDSSDYTFINTSNGTRPLILQHTGGNVGIGTTSPAFLTEIVGGATTVETTLLQIRSNAGGIGTGTTIALGNSTTAAAGSGRVELAGIRDTTSGSSFVIRTADSSGNIQNRVKINESGNLGIGSTSPAARLDVSNDIIGEDGIYIRNTNANNVSAPILRFYAGAAGETASIIRFPSSHGAKPNQLYITNVGATSPITFATQDTERMRIDSSGNLGLGVTPSAWGSGSKGFQVLKGGLWHDNSQFFTLVNNAYYDGTNWKYISTAASSQIAQVNGEVRFYNAPSGTAGDNITLTQAMTLDASGRLGIGITSPIAPLNIMGLTSSTSTPILYLQQGGAYPSYGYTFKIDNVTTGNLFLNRYDNNSDLGILLTIRPDGFLGLGTASPTSRLHLAATDVTGLYKATSTGVAYHIYQNDGGVFYVGRDDQAGGAFGKAYCNILWGSAGVATVFATGNSEKMRLDSSGDLLVGCTSNTTNGGFIFGPNFYGAGRSTQVIGHINGASSGDAYMIFNYNGTGIGSITQSGTTAVLYNTTSDQRLKTNIVNAPSGNIDDIKVRSFDWKSDGSHQEYGMVAQELIEVAPYAVTKPVNSDEMMSVDYSKLIPMMIKEIQDLKQRIATLENK